MVIVNVTAEFATGLPPLVTVDAMDTVCRALKVDPEMASEFASVVELSTTVQFAFPDPTNVPLAELAETGYVPGSVPLGTVAVIVRLPVWPGLSKMEGAERELAQPAGSWEPILNAAAAHPAEAPRLPGSIGVGPTRFRANAAPSFSRARPLFGGPGALYRG